MRSVAHALYAANVYEMQAEWRMLAALKSGGSAFSPVLSSCLVMPVMKAYRIDFNVMYAVEITVHIRSCRHCSLLALFCKTLYITYAFT